MSLRQGSGRVLAVCGALGFTMAAAPAWHTQASGVTVRLRGVSAVSARVAWTSGANGTVARTIDGGATWRVLPVAGANMLDFRDIDAMSDRVAYILSIGPGQASRIYKTADAGAHWVLQFANTDPKVFLDAMTFWNESHGIAVSDSVDGRFVMLTTTNGGRAWEPIPADRLPPAREGEGAYAASGTNIAVQGGGRVWIGTSGSRVLRSSDAGRTWTVTETPLPTGESAGIFSIAFRDTLHGIVVGGDYKKESDAVDNVAITSDGGATWALVRNHGLSGFRSAVAWVPGSTGSWIAVGPSGADASEDDGHSWSPLASDGFDTFSFAPHTHVGWASGASGRVSRFEGQRKGTGKGF